MRPHDRFLSLPAVLAVALLAISACSPAENDSEADAADAESAEMESPAAQPEPASEVLWMGSLSEIEGTGISGQIEAVARSSGTRVRVTLAGAETGDVLPWHVHQGTCGSGGPIVGEPAAYPPLEPGDAGEATATADLTTMLSAGGSYYVNIHRSPDALETIVACGELRR